MPSALQGREAARLLVCGLAWLLGLAGAQARAESCIWYSHDETIRQVRTDNNEVARIVELKNPHRLVMNAVDCGVWTLDKHDRKLLRFNAEGALEREIRVRDLSPGLDEIERLHIDPYDESLWVADDRRIHRFSSSGGLIKSFAAPGEVRRMQVGLDGGLWVLGKRDLWRFSADGKLLASHAVGRHLAGDARYFEVDHVGGFIWIADDNDLARLKLASPLDSPLRIRFRHRVTGFALDPLSGNAWVAQKEALLAYSRAGALVHVADLESRNLRNPEKLAFDPISRSLWAGTERSVNRFTDSGEFVIGFPARDGDEALGVPAFRIQPTLTLVRPPRDALTNDPRPAFTLGYGVACNSVVCVLGNDHLGTYQLSATLNEQPIGSLFAFDPATGQVNFTPAASLPEGTNTFDAQVKDRFGILSNAVTNTFTVDTVAPRFLTLAPPGGSTLQSAQVTVQGSVDDPRATVVLQNAAALGNTAPNPQVKDFAFPIRLASGPNTIVLTAIDPAGNSANATLQLTFQPVSVTIDSPANGASIAAREAIVSGAFQGPPNTGIVVNGIVAITDGNRFHAQVPLQPGSNVLNVLATSPDGSTATQSVTVISTGVAPVSVSVSPVYGVAPFKTTFELSNTTGRAIKQIQADYNGDGTADFTTSDPRAILEFTYNTPGIYTARFAVLDDQNTSHAVSAIIQADERARVDQVLRATWSGFTQALAARDKATAMQYLNAQGREKYGPVIDALLPNIPQILVSFSDLQSMAIDGAVGEYAVNRVIDGVNRIFFIYFLRDTDGVWRLDSM